MIKREIFIFLIVGALTVLVDFSTYFILLSLNIWSIAVCKAIGFITGTLFAYLANKTWTFGHTQPARGSVLRFGLLYSATLAANVLVNNSVLSVLSSLSDVKLLAFLVATFISATLNFLGMKFLVFKPKNWSPV